MSASSTASFLKRIFDNKPVRSILKLMLRKHPKYNKTYLELGLESLAGIKHEERDPLIFLSKLIVSVSLDLVTRSFGDDKQEKLEDIKKPYNRRGVVALVKGIAEFGVRKPLVPGAPFLVVWDYTYRCNLRCKHCYIDAGVDRGEMSISEKRRALDIMADAGVVSIAFSGGEPLLGDGIFEMIKRANEYGIFTALATNATLITKDVAIKLKRAGLGYVQISLDAPIPSVHDEFRGINGAWEKTIRGIKNAREAGLIVEISTTITRYNYHLIDDMLELARNLGAEFFMHFNFIPTGRGLEIVDEDITPWEREMLLRSFARKLHENFPVATLSTAPQLARVTLQVAGKSASHDSVIAGHFYGFELTKKANEVAEFLGGCGAGRLYISLEPNGDIQPCVFLPIKIGNILRDDFEELWRSNPILESLRDRENYHGFCGKCKYKYICGGCRARAYGYLGDYLGPDPGCIYNLKEWERITRKDKKMKIEKISMNLKTELKTRI